MDTDRPVTPTETPPSRASGRQGGWRLATRLARRRWIAALAALPLLQATGCFPDPIGALNFELQSFFNAVFIDTVAVIVQNLLRL
ncbi:MAG: hypothetical protein H6819_08520 [Phycisphaerales bacterium]|nr:hypothetical protein [Phycisphaerales bacterium]MCB9854150.1 hypothetical protein [Phycisphaerales bacterium]MCB9864714.1 hypothetical protein [Phycisphaerales bacterium]